MKVLDLFSGIGGFSLGLERAGMETVAFCEIEEFPRKVLAKHWPGVKCYTDVRTLTAERLKDDGIGAVDVITGGFPCQDISIAGHKKGLEGERSGLWSECARLLGSIQPKYAIFENVTNLLNGERGDWFKRVLWDVSQVGYDAEWHCIPASSVGAIHSRERIWIVVYPNKIRRFNAKYPQGVIGPAWNKIREEVSVKGGIISDKGRFIEEVRSSDFIRKANGLSGGMDEIAALGNAVVPQIPEIIGRAIMEIENANPN